MWIPGGVVPVVRRRLTPNDPLGVGARERAAANGRFTASVGRRPVDVGQASSYIHRRPSGPCADPALPVDGQHHPIGAEQTLPPPARHRPQLRLRPPRERSIDVRRHAPGGEKLLHHVVPAQHLIAVTALPRHHVRKKSRVSVVRQRTRVPVRMAYATDRAGNHPPVRIADQARPLRRIHVRIAGQPHAHPAVGMPDHRLDHILRQGRRTGEPDAGDPSQLTGQRP